MNDLDKLLQLIRSQEFGDALRFLQSVTDVGSVGRTWKSDAEKMELFVRDSFAFVMGEAAKAFDALKQGDPAGAEIVLLGLAPFIGDFEKVAKAYADKAAGLKFQFPRDIWSGRFRDPFKNERKLAADFRAKWLS